MKQDKHKKHLNIFELNIFLKKNLLFDRRKISLIKIFLADKKKQKIIKNRLHV